MSINIFLIYNIYYLCCLCIDFYDLSGCCGCLFVVYVRRFIYKFLNVCPFDYTALAGSGKVGPVNQVNRTSWVAVVVPVDHPKSVRIYNKCRSSTLTNKAVGLYDGPCPNLIRNVKVRILVPLDYMFGIFQPFDLTSLPDGRLAVCQMRMLLNNFDIVFSPVYTVGQFCIQRISLTMF